MRLPLDSDGTIFCTVTGVRRIEVNGTWVGSVIDEEVDSYVAGPMVPTEPMTDDEVRLVGQLTGRSSGPVPILVKTTDDQLQNMRAIVRLVAKELGLSVRYFSGRETEG